MTALMVFAIAQMAQAATSYEIPADQFFADFTNKNADGTKLYTTLTIYYEPLFDICTEEDAEAGICEEGTSIPSFCYDGGERVKMTYFIRATKGSDMYSFASSEDSVCYFNTIDQINRVKEFIGSTVVPMIDSTATEFDIKSADKITQDNEGDNYGCCDEKYFVIMDITIAYK